MYILYRASPICNPFYAPLYTYANRVAIPRCIPTVPPSVLGILPGAERKRTGSADEPVRCGSPLLKPFPACPPANLFPRSTQRVQKMSPPSAQGTSHHIFCRINVRGLFRPWAPCGPSLTRGLWGGWGFLFLGSAWSLSHIVSDKGAPRPLLTACLPRATLLSTRMEIWNLDSWRILPYVPPKREKKKTKGCSAPHATVVPPPTFPRRLIRASGVRHLLT